MTPTTERATIKDATAGNRSVREIIRDEQVMRRHILAALEDGPLTVPEIATAVEQITLAVTLVRELTK